MPGLIGALPAGESDPDKAVERLWNAFCAMLNFPEPTAWSDSTKVVVPAKCYPCINLQATATTI